MFEEKFVKLIKIDRHSNNLRYISYYKLQPMFVFVHMRDVLTTDDILL